MDFGIWQIVLLVITGLVAGTLGGMLGVGGSVIMIPAMQVLLKQNQHLYQASAMIVNVFVAAPSSWRHWKSGVVLPRILRWLIPFSVVSALVGVYASNLSFFSGANTVNLARIFGAFLVYVVLYNGYRLIWGRYRLPEMDQARVEALPPWRISLVGVMMGFMAGLLGIGGGALAVPLQQVILRMPLKNAIGNSACTILVSAFLASIYKNFTLAEHGVTIAQSLMIAAALIPSAFCGGYLGAILTHKLPRDPVRVLFIAMMAVAAWKMFSVKPKTRPAPASQPAAVAPASQPGGVAPAGASPAAVPASQP